MASFRGREERCGGCSEWVAKGRKLKAGPVRMEAVGRLKGFHGLFTGKIAATRRRFADG